MDVPVTKSKDNSGIMIASVAGFILLSLGTIIFLYNQNQNLKTKLANYQPQPIVSPTPMPTIIETASPSASPKPIKTTTFPSATPISR